MPLNEAQKKRLTALEDRLKTCLRTGAYEESVEITKDIQDIFSDDRTNHRLLKAKLWYFEIELLANRHSFAEAGLVGIIDLANEKTKLRLEAQTLLAICYLRQRLVEKAKPLVREVFNSVNSIQSERSRRLFQRKLLQRLEEECVLSSLISKDPVQLDVLEIHETAVSLIQNKSDDEILVIMATNLPECARLALRSIRKDALSQIRSEDIKLIASGPDSEQPKEIGSKTLKILKRIAWKSICSRDSNLYKLWSKKIPDALGPGYLTTAVVTSMSEWRIGAPMIAAGLAAVIMKASAQMFCEAHKPEPFMTDRSEITRDKTETRKKKS